MASSGRKLSVLALVTACAASLPRLAVGELRRLTWAAPADSHHLRRLANSGAVPQTKHVTVQIVKLDTFGPEGAKADISFEDEDQKRVQLFFPGTDGNKWAPHWLHLNSEISVTGHVEVDPDAEREEKQELGNPEMAAGLPEPGNPDSRAVFVVERAETEVDDEDFVANGSRRLGNMAPVAIQASVVLVNPCDAKLTHATNHGVQSAVFGNGAGSVKNILSDCSKNSERKAVMTGVVIGPIDICPSSSDPYAVYDAVNNHLKDNMDWTNLQYKAIVLPDSWIPNAAGLGEVKGDKTWLRDSVVQKANVFIHEWGHNFGLHHAAGKFIWHEYSDSSSAMGSPISSICFNFLHSWQLGYADFMDEQVDGDHILAGNEVSLTLPEVGGHFKSGVKFEVPVLTPAQGALVIGSTPYLVLSWRSRGGFDKHMSGSSKANKVYVHQWYGGASTTAHKTLLLHELERESTTVIQVTEPGQMRSSLDTGIKITVMGNKYAWEASEIQVILCKATDADQAGNPSPCSSVPTTTTPVYTPPPSPASNWMGSFSDEASSQQISCDGALVGLECSTDYCNTMRYKCRPGVEWAESSGGTTVVGTDTGALFCNEGQVATRITCVGSSCRKVMLHCHVPTNAVVSKQGYSTAWFPQALHLTGDYVCDSGRQVIIGVYCGSARCGRKMLLCADWEQEPPSSSGGGATPAGEPGSAAEGEVACIPTCDSQGLVCGPDGCGGSCGECSQGEFCVQSTGQCGGANLMSTWGSSEKSITDSNLVSTGLSCQGRYCEEVRLTLLGITSDATTVEYSEWLSDNLGAKYLWNQGEEAGGHVADCPDDKVVSNVECQGKYCDNIRMHCATPLRYVVDMTAEPWHSDWFSEEQGRQDCPEDYAITGIECRENEGLFCVTKCGDYCDDKRIRCRPIRPENLGLANFGVLAYSALPSTVEQGEPAKQTDKDTGVINLAARPGVAMALAGGTFSLAAAVGAL